MKTKVSRLLIAMLLVLAMTFPIVSSASDALPTLKVLGTYNNFDPNNDPTGLAITEKTGYDVEYSMLPSDNADQNLFMQIASGESYDIVRSSANAFRTLVERGALLALDELLDEYGNVLKDVISQESWDLVRQEGKIYGIPMMNERPNIESTILMREDILQALSLSVPQTPEEFYQVLKAVKEAYPDMIPFVMAGGIYSETLISGFGFYFDWNERDGKLVHYMELPEYQEYLKFMLKLYNEGLIDQDLAINTSVTVNEKFSSGKAFAVNSSWFDASTQVPALYEVVKGALVTYVDPLMDEQGNAAIRANKYLNNVSYIPKNAQNPEDAIKFMNKKLSEDVFTFITLGIEGEHFTKEGDKYYPIMPIFTELRSNAWWYLNGIREADYADMWLARTRRNPELGKAFDAANANFEKYGVYSPVGTMPTLPAVAKNTTALNQMLNDYTIQLMVGVEELGNFDNFLEQWNTSGGAESTNEINQWYSSK